MAAGKIQVLNRVLQIFPYRNDGFDSRSFRFPENLRKIGIEGRIAQVRMGIDQEFHDF
jgi:hypothetical protein